MALRDGTIAALLAALAACAPPPRPDWIRLAENFQPAAIDASPAAWSESPWRLEPEVGGAGAWVRRRVPDRAWRREEGASVFGTPFELEPTTSPASGEASLRCGSPDRSFEFVHPWTVDDDPSRLAAGTFTTRRNRLYVAVPDGSPPPADVVVAAFYDRGVPNGGAWSVGIDRYSGEGFAVWPGLPEEVSCNLPAGSMLRFATVTRSLIPRAPLAPAALENPRPPIRFRVLLDGETILEHVQTAGFDPVRAFHEVALPSDGRTRATLRFETDGAPALAAILAPTVGPAEIGEPSRRPWTEERPHVAIFLADTFRADLMESYGGPEDLTPFLDRFAQGCLLFERAWASSTWTLPSHASMFTGLHPYEHQATRRNRALDLSFTTLAEVFGDAGYRTVGITDQGFVAREFGMDQGFQTFDAERDTFAFTLQRVREALEEDDGRPLFLFVQTYRAHSPFTVSDETRERLASRYDFEGEYVPLYSSLFGPESGWERGEPLPERLRPTVESLHELYLGGAADVDRGFERFVGLLRQRDLLEGTHLVFTSDHGEAFGEHRDVFHPFGLWEESVRVPLLVRGPGIAPGRSPVGASHVDFAPTLCELAGIETDAPWRGRSLVRAVEDAAVLAFECAHPFREEEEFALMRGGRKVLGTFDESGPALEPSAAFDLAVDPREREDRAPTDDWPRALLEEGAGEVRSALEARVEAGEVRLNPSHAANLRHLGYVDS